MSTLTKAKLDSFVRKFKFAEKLAKLGWIAKEVLDSITEDQLTDIYKQYQNFHGIEVTGDLDRVTERSLHCIRICNHPDMMPMTENLMKWPSDGRPVTWTIVSKFPTLSTADAQQAYQWSMDQWMAVCGIDVRFNPNPKTADIVINVNQIDGRAGILAQSQLPNGTRQVMEQVYDSSEPYVMSESPRPFEIDIGRVMCHENGHVIGISHISNGNLLQPMYDLRIRTPQAGDIREAVSRYGPPKAKAPEPRPNEKFIIELEGASNVTGIKIPGFNITKV